MCDFPFEFFFLTIESFFLSSYWGLLWPSCDLVTLCYKTKLKFSRHTFLGAEHLLLSLVTWFMTSGLMGPLVSHWHKKTQCNTQNKDTESQSLRLYFFGLSKLMNIFLKLCCWVLCYIRFVWWLFWIFRPSSSCHVVSMLKAVWHIISAERWCCRSQGEGSMSQHLSLLSWRSGPQREKYITWQPVLSDTEVLQRKAWIKH